MVLEDLLGDTERGLRSGRKSPGDQRFNQHSPAAERQILYLRYVGRLSQSLDGEMARNISRMHISRL